MPSSLVNQQLVDELVKRQMAEEKFMPKAEPIGHPGAEPMSPRMSMLLGSLGDAASTYTFLKRGNMHEDNPMFSYYNDKPWTVFPTAAAAGMGYNALYNLLKKKSPRVADMAAGILGANHGALAGRNLDTTAKGARMLLANDDLYLPTKGTR